MNDSDSEAQENGWSPHPLRPQKLDAGLPFGIRLRKRLTHEIDTKRGDVVLIGCFFCSGIIDSVAFTVYGCFVSMQTGNTIFVGLGVSGQPSKSPTFAWTKALTAILSFCIGALCFATFHRLLSPRKRYVLIVSFALQTALVIVAAALVTSGVVSNTAPSFKTLEAHRTQKVSQPKAGFPFLDLLPIGLLAFQSAGQVVASRVLKYKVLPTVVLTSLYCDLMSDAHLLTAGIFEDPQRNRRAAAAVMLFAGAICGGFLTKGWPGCAGALWLAAGTKGLMALAWVFWKPKEKEEDLDSMEPRVESGHWRYQP